MNTRPVLLSALLMPMLCVPLAAHADDAPALGLSDLLRRHALAVGTPTARPTSGRVSGTFETGGERGVWAATYKAPDKEYNEQTIGARTSASGTDGTVYWQRDANGGVRQMTREELKDERTNAEDSLDLGVAQAHLSLRPQAEHRTGDYVVDALPPGGKPLVIFVDPKTFLVAKTQVQDDERTVTTTYDQWQSHNGVVRPTHWKVSEGDRKYDEDVTVTGVEDNIAAPDSLFMMPTPLKNYHFLKPGATSATVPFDYNGDKIALTVEINGVPVRVALDSGSSGIALSQPLADLLKLKESGRSEAIGIGGTHGQRAVTLDTFTVTDALQFSHISAASGVGLIRSSTGILAALVGYDLLSHFVVRIDYANQQITFTEPDAFHPSPDDGTPLPLELDGDTPSVTAQLDGLPPARFLLDTGDPDTLQLNVPYVQANKLTDRYPRGKGRDVVLGGIAGQAEYDVFHAQSLTLAGLTIPGIPIYIPRDSKGGASQLIAGTLGAEVLSRFVVTFDYPHSRLYLAPGATAATPFDTRTFGIDLLHGIGKDGKLHIFVIHLDPSSPAFKNGLRVLDEITAVDGQSIGDVGYSEVHRRLSLDSDQPAHQITYREPGGKTRTAEARLFDLLPSP